MTIEEVQKHWRYCGLSKQQRLYVVARCLGKEKLDAAKEAWEHTSDESAQAMANRAERNGNIDWLIKEFRGGNLPTREDIIRQLSSVSVAAPDFKDKIAALKILCQYYPPDTQPGAPPSKPDDGDVPFDES